MPDYLDFFRPLLEYSNVVSFVYDLGARRVAYISKAYEQIIGDPISHIDDDLPLLLARAHPDDWEHLRQQVAQAALEEIVSEIEIRLMRVDNSLQWFSVTVSRVPLREEGIYLIGSARDITAEKQASLNAQKFNTKKDATLEILSHDLATPLVLLQQLTEQLAWEVNSTSESVQELLRLMQRTCTHGVNLIRDFVDTEFLESANVELKCERADLVAWLDLVVAEYQRSEQHTHLHFSFDATEESIYASFDINKLQQVVNNLISNAIKFTPDGGNIAIGIVRRGKRVLLTVTDNGIGIPKHFQPLLFEKFTKARRPGLRGERTTGLGMSVIKTIVNLHQGKIWLDSTEGQGTTFYVELPALPPL
jgi:two-component system sensor histidine kinase VicK